MKIRLSLIKPIMIFVSLLISINISVLYAEDNNKKITEASKESTVGKNVPNLESGEAKKVDGSRYILNCSECHGFDGNSLSQEWPNIAGLNKQYIINQLEDFKSGKRVNEEMTQIVREFPSAKELVGLAQYFSEQKMINRNTPDVINKHDLAKLTIGEEIFTGKRIEYGIPACSACHGKDGMGDKEGNFPRLVGQNIDYIVRQMELFRAKKRSNDTPPQMRNIAQEMDDEDIASVAAFIAYMKPSEP